MFMLLIQFSYDQFCCFSVHIQHPLCELIQLHFAGSNNFCYWTVLMLQVSNKKVKWTGNRRAPEFRIYYYDFRAWSESSSS